VRVAVQECIGSLAAAYEGLEGALLGHTGAESGSCRSGSPIRLRSDRSGVSHSCRAEHVFVLTLSLAVALDLLAVLPVGRCSSIQRTSSM